MNAVITNRQPGQDLYLGKVFEILAEQTMEFHSIEPPHKFLSSLIIAGIQGNGMNNQGNAWNKFETFFENRRLPFEVFPLGVMVLEDLDLCYSFRITHHLSGKLKGHYIEVLVVISNTIQSHLYISLDLQMSDLDWDKLAKSIEQKYLLWKLDAA